MVRHGAGPPAIALAPPCLSHRSNPSSSKSIGRGITWIRPFVSGGGRGRARWSGRGMVRLLPPWCPLPLALSIVTRALPVCFPRRGHRPTNEEEGEEEGNEEGGEGGGGDPLGRPGWQARHVEARSDHTAMAVWRVHLAANQVARSDRCVRGTDTPALVPDQQQRTVERRNGAGSPTFSVRSSPSVHA
jgi:hypothetical protein